MNRLNSKKLIITLIVIAAGISVIPVIGIIFNSTPVTTEITVLYDNNNETTIKSTDLIESLLIDPGLILKKRALSSSEELSNQIQNQNSDGLILIGHGSIEGFHIGGDVTSWHFLRGLILNNSIENALFLSCYSSLLCLNETAEMKNQYITFDCEIDYMVASYAGAIMLSHNMDLEDLEDETYDKAIDNLNIIVDHALYCIEPLWWGSSHNHFADEAILDILQELLNILSINTQLYMDKASEADVVDQVSTATIETILTDPVRRDLWLKHNYGTRGGITIAVFWIPVYTVPVYYGTAPEAAQNAYNLAVEAYRNKDYAEAGKQLSYVVHYGQDMTMPYHVYDYLTLYLNVFSPINLVTVLVNIVKFVDDYGDLEVHNIMEEWAYYEWVGNSNFVADVLSQVPNIDIGFSEGMDSIYECVENIAKSTRSHIRENRMENIFKGDDEDEKRDAISPLLAKAVAFTNALYEKFIDDVCNAPETPNRPDGPFLSYENYTNTFKFKTVDPDGDEIKFEIDWGDGIIEQTNYVASGITYEVKHSYTSLGLYNVSARAVDFHDNQIDRLWSNWSELKQIIVEFAPTPPPEPSKPSIGGSTTVYVDSIATFSALSYDPEGGFLLYKFNFGDGTIWYSDPTQSGLRVYKSHIYTTTGHRTLTVTVENFKGGTNQNSIEITIIEEPVDPTNYAPVVVSIVGPTDGSIDIPYQFQFKAIDPNENNVKYEIDWGDGESTITQFYASGTTLTHSHVWDNYDVYQIKYRAQDELGLWSDWSNIHVIQITDGPIIVP